MIEMLQAIKGQPIMGTQLYKDKDIKSYQYLSIYHPNKFEDHSQLLVLFSFYYNFHSRISHLMSACWLE